MIDAEGPSQKTVHANKEQWNAMCGRQRSIIPRIKVLCDTLVRATPAGARKGRQGKCRS